MHALRIYAGPAALKHIRQHGLLPQHVGAIPAAAGGPKGLILGPIDRFVFGEWLPGTTQPVHLVGASIGAWRMATACLDHNVPALEQLERNYIAQQFDVAPGQKRPTAAQVSGQFRHNLEAFYGGRMDQVLSHPRYRLHIVTSRGRGVLAQDGRLRTPLGYLGAFAANAVHRRALAGWVDRVVFSNEAPVGASALPFDTDDFKSHEARLTARNFMDALQASCSIPFVLQPVQDIEGAPRGAYWDGGITDYHLHLRYRLPAAHPLVLYPHFQQSVVPGWLDKVWKRRHHATSALDHMVVLAPDPAWVRRLPQGRLPDRTDFTHFGQDLEGRMRVWTQATSAARQLADEFSEWLHQPDLNRLEPL